MQKSSTGWLTRFMVICSLLVLFIGCGDDDDDDSNPLAIPAIPTGLTVALEGDGVTLTWQASANSARYNIYRSTQQNEGYALIGTAPQTNFKNASLQPDTTYFYKIAGVSAKIEGREVEGDRSPPVQVTFVIAKIDVDPRVIDFGESHMSLPLKIINKGGASLEWEIQSDVKWLTFNSTKGKLEGRKEVVITVEADRNNDPGIYDATITVTSKQDKPITIPTKLVISPEPVLSVDAKRVDFGLEREPKVVEIGNAGTGTLDWKAEKEKDVSWLEISPASGSGVKAGEKQELTLKILPQELTGFDPGANLVGTIVITAAPDQERKITVTAETEKPILAVSQPTTINMGLTQRTATATIQNNGSGTLDWTIRGGANWLEFTPRGGTTRPNETDQVTLTVDREGLDEGLKSTTIVIDAGLAGQEEITINIQVPGQPNLTVTPRSLDFGTTENTKTIQIKNTGTGLMEWQISGGRAWLTATPQSGDTRAETDTVRLTVDRRGLQPGTQNTSINISAGDAGRETVTITMRVPQPELTLSQNILVFNLGEIQKAIQIENTGEGTLVWDTNADREWIVVRPPSASTSAGAPTNVTIEVNDDRLDAGRHAAVVTFSSNGGAKTLNIQFTKQGVITGTIRNIRTNAPISDATVNIPTQEALTGFDGHYVLPYAEEGEYILEVEARGYIGRRERVVTANGRGEKEILLTPIVQTTREISDPVKLITPKRIAFREGRAYVTSDVDNSVAIINTTTDRVIDKIPLKCDALLCDPIGIAANPRRAEVYVAIPGADRVSVLNADANSEVRQIEVGNFPIACAVSHDGDRLYVSNQRDNTVSVIDLNTLNPIDLIRVGREPAGMAISPDDIYLYVSNNKGDSVSVIDVNAGIETTKISVGSRPDAIGIAENGRYVYVVNTFSNELSVIDISTQQEIARIPDLSTFALVGVAAVREDVHGREIAYVVGNDGTISVIEMPSQTVIRDIGIRAGGGEVEAIGYDSDVDKFYVLDSALELVTVLEK